LLFTVPCFWFLDPALDEFPGTLDAVVVELTSGAVFSFVAAAICEDFIRAGALQPSQWTVAKEAIEILFGVFDSSMAREELTIEM